MSDAQPWFTRPWRDPVGERRGVLAALGYTLVGLSFVVLAAAGSGSSVGRVLELCAGVVFAGLGITLAATLRWRQVHGAARP